MAKAKGGSKNTATIKKKGDRGGVAKTSGKTGQVPYGALPGSGGSDTVGQVPKKTRVIGTGQH